MLTDVKYEKELLKQRNDRLTKRYSYPCTCTHTCTMYMYMHVCLCTHHVCFV